MNLKKYLKKRDLEKQYRNLESDDHAIQKWWQIFKGGLISDFSSSFFDIIDFLIAC